MVRNDSHQTKKNEKSTDENKKSNGIDMGTIDSDEIRASDKNSIEFSDGSTFSGSEIIFDSDESVDDNENNSNEMENNAKERKSTFTSVMKRRDVYLEKEKADGSLDAQKYMHVDDLSSDDEENANLNTIGRVPMHWYDEYEHIGYDRSGERIIKSRKMDNVDLALAAQDDPNFSRTIYDAYNDRNIILSNRDLELIRRIQAGAFPHPEFDAEEEYNDYYTSQVMKTSFFSGNEPKCRFTPSAWEAVRVAQIVKAIKSGRMKLYQKEKDNNDQIFDMWKETDEDILRNQKNKRLLHLPAPKIPLPGHADSYRPPEEYLPSSQNNDNQNKIYDSLRKVGAYKKFCRERYERCLDLYLCPRSFKLKLNIDPESLLPKLPNPQDLKPFPNELCLTYGELSSLKITAITVSTDGQYLISGDELGILTLWEVSTTRKLSSINLRKKLNILNGKIAHLAWNPNPLHHIVAVAVGKAMVLVSTGTAGGDAAELTEALLSATAEHVHNDDITEEERVQSDDEVSLQEISENMKDIKVKMVHAGKWEKVMLRIAPSVSNGKMQIRGVVKCVGLVGWIAWHSRGDYIASVVSTPSAGAGALAVHQISKARSQAPLKSKSKGEPQCACFHPSKPFLFMATKQSIKVYHLVKQIQVKKMITGCKWISYIDVHASGDHLLIGSLDRKVVWFDMDMATTPYKTFKYHKEAVRCVAFHKQFPLMASASDDGTIHIFHATVFSDLLKNPMIIPLKILRSSSTKGRRAIIHLVFHPRLPWLFAAGADGTIRLYQDI